MAPDHHGLSVVLALARFGIPLSLDTPIANSGDQETTTSLKKLANTYPLCLTRLDNRDLCLVRVNAVMLRHSQIKLHDVRVFIPPVVCNMFLHSPKGPALEHAVALRFSILTGYPKMTWGKLIPELAQTTFGDLPIFFQFRNVSRLGTKQSRGKLTQQRYSCTYLMPQSESHSPDAIVSYRVDGQNRAYALASLRPSVLPEPCNVTFVTNKNLLPPRRLLIQLQMKNVAQGITAKDVQAEVNKCLNPGAEGDSVLIIIATAYSKRITEEFGPDEKPIRVSPNAELPACLEKDVALPPWLHLLLLPTTWLKTFLGDRAFKAVCTNNQEEAAFGVLTYEPSAKRQRMGAKIRLAVLCTWTSLLFLLCRDRGARLFHWHVFSRPNEDVSGH